MPAIYGSDWVQDYLHLDGRPYSLVDYPFARDFYDQDAVATLLMTCRQIGKSTVVANRLIMNSCLRAYWKQLFVAPTQEQTQRFSQARYGRVLALSPRLQGRWLADESSRVLYKSFKNGSECYLSYAAQDADRIRGITAQEVCYDEVQDMDYDAVLPVVGEVQSSFDVAYELFCGTPKTMENTIERLWQDSTQTEWMVRCDACAKFSTFRDDRCLGLKGPICSACGAYLNVRNGLWVDTKSFPGTHQGKIIKGFHISQPMLPRNVPASMAKDATAQSIALGRWKRILAKYESYPTAQFSNEVLGVSNSLGARLITLEELRSFCTERSLDPTPTHKERYYHIVAGIDWSGGGMNNNSHTVIYIWGVNPASEIQRIRLDTLYYKIYTGANAISDGTIQDIISLLRHYNVDMVLGDAGGGALANDHLRAAFGPTRARQVQYKGGDGSNATSGRPPFYWNKLDRYMADRTVMIDHYLAFVRYGGARFAAVAQMEEGFRHVMSVYEDVSPSGKKVWRRTAGTPDDTLHAMVFGWMAANVVMGNPMFAQEIA